MAGCYGNSWEDRQREAQLDRYLSTQEEESEQCDGCGRDIDADEIFECEDCHERLGPCCDDYGLIKQTGICFDCWVARANEDPESEIPEVVCSLRV